MRSSRRLFEYSAAHRPRANYFTAVYHGADDDLLRLESTDQALEIGAGRAIRRRCWRSWRGMFTLEVCQLATACRERLAQLGFANVTVHTADGNAGCVVP